MTRTYAIVVGIVFLVAGILGFVPAITVGHEYLFGIFAVDAVHNVINLVIGVLGIAAYSGGQSRPYCQVLGIVALLIGILGFIPAFVVGEGMLFGLFHVNVADNVVYLIVGVIGVFLGFAPRSSGERVSPTH